jgi:AcrR family transcriptional regulator
MSASIEAALESLCDDPNRCRERLLHTAGIFYAERGLDRVSTRELTRAAGANLAAIAYYFGSKDGLREAVLDYVVAASRERIAAIFARLSAAVDAAGSEPERLAEASAQFAAEFLRASLPLNRETWWVTIITRAMGNLSPSEERLYEAVFRPANRTVRKLVFAATGESDPDRLGVLTEAVIGDFVMFCKNASVVQRSLGWDSYSPEHIDQIVPVVARRMIGRLGLPLPASLAPPHLAAAPPADRAAPVSPA